MHGRITTALLVGLASWGPWTSECSAADVTAAFSDDATEDSVGIFMEANRIIQASPGGYDFQEAKFLMRPFTLGTGSAVASRFILSVRGPLSAFLPDGTPIPLPATYTAQNLPGSILVSADATGFGEVALTAYPAMNQTQMQGVQGQADRVRVRIGPFPGLAGHSLAQYPFFQFTSAINDNATVQTAIDPTRHEERKGLSYDIYIVDRKTPAQWAANAALVDITSAVETATVVGTNIQFNTTTAWGSNLQGDAGLEFGVPYDVVFDFGQDGQLDPGDMIDGFDVEEAGFYVMADPNVPGPFNISSFEFDDPGLFRTEGFDGGGTRNMRSRGVVVYPDPLPPGQLPLVTFSHGNTGVTRSYRGYRYLQDLLASYGFITASFDMFPAHVNLGIRWRGWLSNKNTERLILQTDLVDHNDDPYPPMGGGVIDEKVDPDRIITVGHSRGGEGVIIQYQQHLNPDIGGIRPPNGTLQGFDADSFLGVVPIAQVTFLTINQGSRTDLANFLMFFGSSDNDVCGCSASVLPTIHWNRAEGNKMMAYLYGAGHGYFNELWSCTCTGPDRMTRAEVEAITAAYLSAFVHMVTYDNVPAKDYFTRSPDRFRPIGTEFVTPSRRIVNMYRDALPTGNFVIDDYEENDDEFTSSSGQPVYFDVADLWEGFMKDANPTGGWASNQPDGGFWWETRGAIFNWNGTTFHYVQTIAPEERDFSDDKFLQFLTCQQSDHPETEAEDGDRDISVTLVDGNGTRSSINTTSYGGIDDPYIRSAGGWGQAFKTYRLRIADFETNGSGLDLTNIVEMRIEVGSDHGSLRGRLGFDDFELIK